MQGEGAGHVDGKSQCFFLPLILGKINRVNTPYHLGKIMGSLNTQIVLLTEMDGNGATAAKCTAQVCNSADSSTHNSI